MLTPVFLPFGNISSLYLVLLLWYHCADFIFQKLPTLMVSFISSLHSIWINFTNTMFISLLLHSKGASQLCLHGNWHSVFCLNNVLSSFQRRFQICFVSFNRSFLKVCIPYAFSRQTVPFLEVAETVQSFHVDFICCLVTLYREFLSVPLFRWISCKYCFLNPLLSSHPQINTP